MSDTSSNATIAKPKRETVAIRDWIDSAGNPLSAGDEAQAVGFRYTHLPSAKKVKPDFNPETDAPPTGTYYNHTFPKVGEPVTVDLLMSGIFGALTLAGNVVNSATNGPKGDPNLNPIELIRERFAEIAGGTWAERAAGVGGVRYDKDMLAAAIASAKGESDPAPYLAKMDNKVDPKTGATVPADSKGAISYGAFALRNAKVKDAYDRLTGGGSSIDAL